MSQPTVTCQCSCGCQSKVAIPGICGFCRKGLHWEPDSPSDAAWEAAFAPTGPTGSVRRHEKSSATIRIMGTGRGPKAPS